MYLHKEKKTLCFCSIATICRRLNECLFVSNPRLLTVPVYMNSKAEFRLLPQNPPILEPVSDGCGTPGRDPRAKSCQVQHKLLFAH